MKDLKLAITNQLVNDADYLALMEVPTEFPYRTYFEKPPEVPTFPETVFNFVSTGYDASQHAEMLAADIQLNITVWSKDDSYEDIADRIKVLFHQKTIGNTGAHAVLLGEPLDRRDEDFDVYGKTIRFAVFYRRVNL